MNIKIDMVIVTYNPDKILLERCISSIINSVRTIYLVDNSDRSIIIKSDSSKINLMSLKRNMGVAYAQNKGIRKSINNDSDYILLSDQDTVFPEGYVRGMVEMFMRSDQICAVTPLFQDHIVSRINDGFFIESLLFSKKIFPESGNHEIFHTIASGMLLKTECLAEIGLMREDLFIDWIDYEWCWRARNKSYRIIGNADIVIHHQLGDESINIKFREVNLRSPIRHYYITRNAFYLATRDSSLSVVNRTFLFLKSFEYVIGYPILSKPHLIHLKYVSLGFWHGLTGKLGEFK